MRVRLGEIEAVVHAGIDIGLYERARPEGLDHLLDGMLDRAVALLLGEVDVHRDDDVLGDVEMLLQIGRIHADRGVEVFSVPIRQTRRPP